MERVEWTHEWVFARLAAFMDGELDEEDTTDVATHLAECAICKQQLEELRTVEAARVSGPDEKAPQTHRDAFEEELHTAPKPRRYDLVTAGDLANLVKFRSEQYPVLSLYLDVTPPERQNRKYLAKFKRLVQEAKMHLDSTWNGHARDLQDEIKHLHDWLQYGYDGTGCGLAVFTCYENSLWRAFRLPVATRDRLIVADRPYVRPLAALAEEHERYAVLLVNKKIARLFAVYMGEIQEYTEVLDEVVPRPKAGGWSAEKYQRHHDMHVLWHVKNAVHALEEFYSTQECDWLVIGGTEEPVAELRDQLPQALRERLAGEISISTSAGPNEILARLLKIERQTEQQVEARRVEQLITAALKDGPAVLGLAHTLVALVEGRVMMLVVESGFSEPGFECANCHYLTITERPSCPLCGAELLSLPDVVERAVERAIDQQTEIEVLRGEARDRLAAHGHIGALLRY